LTRVDFLSFIQIAKMCLLMNMCAELTSNSFSHIKVFIFLPKAVVILTKPTLNNIRQRYISCQRSTIFNCMFLCFSRIDRSQWAKSSKKQSVWSKDAKCEAGWAPRFSFCF